MIAPNLFATDSEEEDRSHIRTTGKEFGVDKGTSKGAAAFMNNLG